MDDFLSEDACRPNLNTATLAGIVGPNVQTPKANVVRWTVQVEHHWPDGKTSTIGIPCHTSGEKVEKLLTWLNPGETVLVQGALRHRSTPGEAGSGLEVYAYRVERLLRAEPA